MLDKPPQLYGAPTPAGRFVLASIDRSAMRYASLLIFFALATGCGSGGSGGEYGADTSELWVGDGPARAYVSWTPPEKNEDGSPISGPISYRVHYAGLDGVAYSIDVGSVEAVQLHGLAEGEWKFSVSARNSAGVESRPTLPVGLSIFDFDENSASR